MELVKVKIGTTAHCNACDKAFTLETEEQRGLFCGSKAARLNEFSKCPHCGRVDSHWVFAADIAPELEGSFDKRKRALRAWLREN